MSHTYGFTPRTGSKFFPVQRVSIVPRERIPVAKPKYLHKFFPFIDQIDVWYSDDDKDNSVAGIIEEVCRRHGITRGMLTGRSQSQSIVVARREAAQRISALGHSTPEIGQYLKRDHSTILNLLKPKTRKRVNVG